MVQLNVAFALLRFSAQVTLTTSETPRDYSEHEAPSARLSGKGCPAGQYVSQPMAGDPGVVACRPCQPGTFSPYASEETSCLPCALCRKDQEVVTECSPTRDRQCQCKQGHFFCDSMDCEENCFRCQRCEHSAVLRPCNATRDAVCADRPHPQPGDGSTLFIVLGALALLIPGPVVLCCRRRSKSESDGSWRKPERKERQKRGPGFVTRRLGSERSSGASSSGGPSRV